jgi:transposase
MEIRGSKRFWTKQEKRQIVEETLKPGASVSVVARAHNVNANQVFQWRKLYRERQQGIEESPGALVPVKVADLGVQKIQLRPRQKSKLRKNGVIDIDLGHARVRIEGAADPACVRAALAGLIQ